MLRFSFGKICALIAVLFILYYLSFSFQDKKKTKAFLSDLRSSKVYNDPTVNDIYEDFLMLTSAKTEGQDISIKLVDFPYVFDWYADIYNEESNLEQLNDAIGYAAGMNDNSKVEVYVSYKDWKNLNLDEKRKLIYHELLHDFFNIEHFAEPCNIMYEGINSCPEVDLDKQLTKITEYNAKTEFIDIGKKIDQLTYQILDILPYDFNNGVVWTDHKNLNNDSRVYVYSVSNTAIDIVETITKEQLVFDLKENNATKTSIKYNINNIYRYYNRDKLLKEIQITPMDLN